MKMFLFSAILLFTAAGFYAQQQIPPQTDQVIVRFRSGFVLNELSKAKFQTGAVQVDRIMAAYDVQSIRKLNTGKKSDYHAVVLKFDDGADIGKIVSELSKTDVVAYAEPDFIGHGSGEHSVSPIDTYYNRQWGLKNDGTFSTSPAIAGADIDMEQGWALEQGDTSIIVGIIDTGCKLDHPDLQGRIWINYKEIAGNGIDEGNNGYIDDTRGWDFAYSDNNPADDYGHGSNVTGIIGANGNNNVGLAGVDWNCKLMILKGLNNQNWGYYSWWSDAIHYAVDNGANVLNMSIGGTDVSASLQDAVNYALDHNVTIVACMMNTNSNTVFYPAAYPGVIAVGSTNPDDKRSHPFFWSTTSGSNYGSHISVVAPGNYIYGLNYQSNTSYNTYWGGTSQATPHVCGLASLILAQNPSMTPAQIKSLIESTSEDQVGDPAEDTQGWDQYYGYGRINAYNALLQVSGVRDNDKKAQNFSVYPNPNNGIMNLNLLNAPGSKSVVTIINSLDQTVYRDEVKNQISTIKISRVPGIYFIKVKQGNAEQSSKILIY
jgi:subtilisin family serine protease